MASIQIKGRVEEELWESLRLPNETNTELLQRVVADNLAHRERDKRLAAVDNNLDMALGSLLHSHALVQRLSITATLPTTIPTTETITPAEPAKGKKKGRYNVSAY